MTEPNTVAHKAAHFDIVCLSHLKWEQTLFQRPQQIMRRLSKRHRVLYFAHCATREFVRSLLRGDLSVFVGRDNPNLLYINIPYLPFTRHIRLLQHVMFFATIFWVRILAWRFRFSNPRLWLYHPGYVTHLRGLRYKRLIYDCMDLFMGFETTNPRTAAEEMRLLKQADIVFTGGKSLQKAKQGVNPRTYCFPSGLDYDHFAKATRPDTPIPEDIRPIQHPILGYFGAVDERLDYDLVNHLCEKRPDWSVVFLGPLIRYHCVPVEQPNFHYLGKKEYATLPGYLKAFDVCLMPFVISQLTLHISPTKTPEYLAGGKPVVSTAIPDVIEDYSDLVGIAEDYDEFIAKVQDALDATDGDLHLRIKDKAEAQSWDHIAAEMERLVNEIDY